MVCRSGIEPAGSEGSYLVCIASMVSVADVASMAVMYREGLGCGSGRL